MRSRLALALGVSTIVAAAACGAGKGAGGPVAAPSAASSAPAPSASSSAWVEPPDVSIPEIRTGAIAPVTDAAVSAKAIRRHVEGGVETLVLDATDLHGVVDRGVVVAVDGEGAHPFSFVSTSGRTASLWVRRPASDAGKPVTGEVATMSLGVDPGHRIPFRADTSGVPDDPTLLRDWATALQSVLGSDWSFATPWHAFARERVGAVLAPPKAKAKATRGRGMVMPARRPADDDLVRLMETTTGTTSLQEALQQDRGLILAASKAKRTVPIAKLTPPKLVPHPWNEMIARLGGTVPTEPLAAAIPAEFWFVRAKSLGAVLRVLDEVDAWATPITTALDDRGEDRALAARYEAELGLSRGPLTRTFGPDVVQELAATGSDPYFREGTDVTVLFRVKQRTLFDAALGAALAGHARDHGGVTDTSEPYDGVSIRTSRSADGAVHQSRADEGDLAIVSNSPAAVRRVIDAIHGKRAKLADEPDFRFALLRDAKTDGELFAFVGDRFVGEVVGPAQKIAETRRQIALAELSTPAYAALLFGWMNGRSPASADELVKSHLLERGELAHATGEPIAFTPGDAPRSKFGTPRAMTPLLDLPAPDRVTEDEQRAYDRFARTYDTIWSGYVDPVAARASLRPASGGTELAIDVRVLPILEGSDYREIARAVGKAHVHADPIASGVRLVVGLGRDDRMRRDLNDLLGVVRTIGDLKLDWLGEWAMVGAIDRATLATAVLAVDRRSVPQAPSADDRDREERIAEALRAPVYAAVSVSSRPAAAIALGAIRKIADDVLPGTVEWGEHGVHRGVAIVRIFIRGGKKSGLDGDVSVFYALDDDALIVALNEAAIRAVLDARADGHGPTNATKNDGSPQMVLDLATAKGAGLSTVLAWMLESEALRSDYRSRSAAEAIFHGAPETASDPAAARRLSLAYLGSAPVPPDGGTYAFGRQGVVDPARGTLHAPTWPAIPVPGSPVARALGAVSRFRGELSFDDEGKTKAGAAMESLHARTTLLLRDAP